MSQSEIIALKLEALRIAERMNTSHDVDDILVNYNKILAELLKQ